MNPHTVNASDHTSDYKARRYALKLYKELEQFYKPGDVVVTLLIANNTPLNYVKPKLVDKG